MIRTINRSVETVSNPNTDYKYFNHVNWKGIDDSKNYLNIDQETFEDCKNVYVDEEGLLKSRPCIKLNTTDLTNITGKAIKSWKFDEYNCFLMYLTGLNTYHLRVYVNDKMYTNTFNVEPNLMYFDNKVFVFSNKAIVYCSHEGFEDAKNLLYIPTKHIYTNNIKSENEVESDNLLTTSHKLIYNYTNIDFIVNPTFVNEKVTLIVDGEKYVREWVPSLEKVLFTYKTDVPQNVFYNGDYNIDVADNGNLLMSSVIATTDDSGAIYTNWTITFSTNGKYFEYVPSPDFEFFGKPIISKDSFLAVVIGEDGPYAYSLTTDLPTDPTGKRFPVWTNLLTYHGQTAVPTNITDELSYTISANFIDYKNFYYVYGYNKTDDGYSHIEGYHYNGNYCNYLQYTPTTTETFNTKIYTVKLNNNICVLLGTENNVTLLYNTMPSSNLSVNFIKAWTNANLFVIDFIVANNSLFALFKREPVLLLYNVSIWSKALNYITTLDGSTGIILPNEDVITTNGYYQKSDNYKSSIKLLDNNVDKIVTADKYIYFVSNNKLYGNVIGDDLITVERTITGEVNPVNFSHSTELNELYASMDNKLYISSARFKDDQKLLYFPKLNEQKFNNKITNVHPVSSSQVAIFFENEIWYCDWTENGYEYHKSKLSTGLTEGSTVLTSFDGSNIIFPSKRGLVYLGYQELVQSTDQTLTLLTNPIDTRYEKFSNKPIKLFLHKYWLITYGYGNEFYIFDVRNNSWWKWECSYDILNILLIDDKIVMLLNYDGRNIYNLINDGSYEDLYAKDGSKQINWFIRSQKLNLGTLNYHKNIVSIAINNVEQNEYTEEVSYNLDIKNYRLNISNRYNESQNLVYKVNMLRTFVKRCNSRKVNEFQYTLSSDTGMNGSFKQIPLSIHSIIIKYTIAGQVR